MPGSGIPGSGRAAPGEGPFRFGPFAGRVGAAHVEENLGVGRKPGRGEFSASFGEFMKLFRKE